MFRRSALLPCVLTALMALAAVAQAADDLDERLAALVAGHPELARVELLTATRRGREVPLLVIGAGDAPTAGRQGLLLAAGLDGRRLRDTDLLLATVERLLARDDLGDLLAGRMLLVLPRLDRDGAGTLLGGLGPVRESAGNRRPDDADRDGRIDEDGHDDLDGDGVIGWMRVPDGDGEWVIDEHDPRALRKKKDDERGTHRLLREGHDEDGDGALDEDGDDGVALDRNFAHGFAEHDASSGPWTLSEPETRAVVDLLLAHPGLGSVLVIGADDTLVSAPKAAGKVQRGGWGGGFRAPLDGLLEDDVATMKQLGELLETAAGEAGHEVKADGPVDGSLLAWAYHQGGRWPLGFCAWQPPEKLPEPPKDAGEGDDADGDGTGATGAAGAGGAGAGGAAAGAESDVAEDAPADIAEDAPTEEPADVAEDAPTEEPAAVAEDAPAEEPAAPREGRRGRGGRAARDGDPRGDGDADADDKPGSDPASPVSAAVLAWLDAEHAGQGVLPWTPFEHPDLGAVEIGGLAPGATLNPPFDELEPLADTLAAYVLAVLAAAPALVFEEVEVTDHGGGLVTVEAVLVNTGALPTAPRFAADARMARPIRVTPRLPDGAERASGPAQVLVDRLAGHGGRRELRWVLAGVQPGASLVLAVDADCADDFELEVPLR